MGGQSRKSAPSKIQAEASAWVIRMADPDLTEATKASFHEWCDAAPPHRAAFEQAERAWGQLGLMRPQDLRPHRRPGRIAMLALAAGASLWFWQDDLRIRLKADHIAAIGQNLVVTLPDGSRAEMSSGAALAEDFDVDQRLVRLLQGRAYFTAAPATQQSGRPFVVQAGGVRVTALGTQFSVDLHGEEVDVLVTEHSVRVAPVAGPAKPVVLSRGMGVEARPDAIPQPVARDVDFANAWRSGELVFDDRPLAEVVAELNRYRHGRIILHGKDLAARRVSGVFHTNDITHAVDRIADELGLRHRSVPPLLTVIY
ncbi:FecR family protein [Paracoccus shanxieyensis]|uniref:DUF4880 domain-containing protein n=1 Tax=Paracoccus shanxieyensis TaxID=2675752 RepID=A0A6L6J4A1_9RHOB|nr:FecR family protein [Paracoccus shanxieyensis]MTH66711.1 DUF4880 domain-containing protein [Paracoccus shanxieyensis]MTH89944.1 DUF4880 domain-containing protein [Paracoccus shanxieyensis]